MVKIRCALLGILQNKNFRNGIFFAFFSFLNSGISFLIMIVMAHYIKPESYGQLSLFTTLISLFSIFICLNTNGLIGVDFFVAGREKIQRLLNVTLITALVIYLIMLACVFSMQAICENITGLTTLYQFYAISICLVQIIISNLLDIWRLEEKVWIYGIFSFLTTISNLILTILFVGLLDLDWQGRMYAQVLTCVFFAGISVGILIKKGYFKWELPFRGDFIEGWRFGIPLIPHSTSFWIRQGLDRYIINSYFSQSIVGLFSFAYNFANIIQIIGFAFNASNSVNIYQTLANADLHKLKVLRRDCLFYIYFYIVLMLLVYIGALILVPILFPKYHNSTVYLLPLCGGAMFQCFYLVYVNIVIFYKKTKQLMYITFIISLLHCILSFVFTIYGVIYTAYISLFSNFLIFLGVYVYSQRILRIHHSSIFFNE